jgi:hypothetical protein
MPRVKVGPALPDNKTLDIEIARLRDLDVRDLRARWHSAFGRDHPLTCPATSCFGFWPIDFRPIVSAIWMPGANGSSMERDQPKMRASARWS